METHQTSGSRWSEYAAAFQHEGLLRATPVSTALHGFGSLLSDSSGNSATYNLSEPVDSIGYFISHNWCVGRSRKFLVWAYYFNSGKALAAAVGVITACTALKVSGHMPTMPCAWGNCEVLGWLTAIPMFLLVMVIGHEIEFRLSPCHRMVFLDKTCIHQTDSELKRRGIEKLGAFIKSSSHMLVCYSEHYMVKMWTIYELACYLLVHRSKPATFVHVNLPVVLIAFMLLTYITTWILHLTTLDHSTARRLLVLCFSALAYPTLVIAQRELQAMKDATRHFKIRSAKCFDPKDRNVVEDNIVVFMKLSGEVKGDTPDAAALDAFDHLVQVRVPEFVHYCEGRSGLPWRVFFEISAVCDLPNTMNAWGGEIEEADLPEAAALFVHFFSMSIIVMPLSLACASMLIRKSLRIGGKLSIAALVASYILIVTVWLTVAELSEGLAHIAGRSGRAALALVALHICLVVCVLLAFSPIQRRQLTSSVVGRAAMAQSGIDNPQGSAEAINHRSRSTAEDENDDGGTLEAGNELPEQHRSTGQVLYDEEIVAALRSNGAFENSRMRDARDREPCKKHACR